MMSCEYPKEPLPRTKRLIRKAVQLDLIYYDLKDDVYKFKADAHVNSVVTFSAEGIHHIKIDVGSNTPFYIRRGDLRKLTDELELEPIQAALYE